MVLEFGNVLPEIIEGARRRVTQRLQELPLDSFMVVYGPNGQCIILHHGEDEGGYIRSHHVPKDQSLELVLEQLIIGLLDEVSSMGDAW